MPYYCAYRLPKSSYLSVPLKISGSIILMKKEFEALAMSRIKYFDRIEFLDYLGEIIEDDRIRDGFIASPAISLANVKIKKKGHLQGRFLENQEILINLDGFSISGEDYADMLPYVIRHEIEEGWLKTKKGCLEIKTCKQEVRTRTIRHTISERRTFLMAERDGKGERLFELLCKLKPKDKDKFKKSWDKAKRRSDGKAKFGS
jgi:hypothetical protein